MQFLRYAHKVPSVAVANLCVLSGNRKIAGSTVLFPVPRLAL